MMIQEKQVSGRAVSDGAWCEGTPCADHTTWTACTRTAMIEPRYSCAGAKGQVQRHLHCQWMDGVPGRVGSRLSATARKGVGDAG